MDIALILNNEATLDELIELNERRGVEYIIEGGKVTGVIL